MKSTTPLDDLVSNRFVQGVHHFSLIVRAADPDKLNDYLSDAGAALSDAGMKWGKEDIGCAGTYYSQLPGNFKYRVRAGEISSRNFAAFSSFHNFPSGRIAGNQWGPAVTMLETTSGAPFYFSFHKPDPDPNAKLSPDHKELANTVVIGPGRLG
ncbi:hypothetical protein [Pseudomonas sp. JG-B]|uniref:VirB4 family type IV secretion/conjugal transfer ATPase n=1 Tax=Pseudomonas sp. JG-B TaxID=2603214 RepID=UPI00129EB58E|nr:hypothetical protein [Pseudomonas sp. JG-B]MRK19084.1 hypothetical protein [Pseudomonas sp. JG-B]